MSGDDKEEALKESYNIENIAQWLNINPEENFMSIIHDLRHENLVIKGWLEILLSDSSVDKAIYLSKAETSLEEVFNMILGSTRTTHLILNAFVEYLRAKKSAEASTDSTE